MKVFIKWSWNAVNFEKNEASLKGSKDIYYVKEVVSLSFKLTTIHIHLLFRVNTDVKFRNFFLWNSFKYANETWGNFQLLSSQSLEAK